MPSLLFALLAFVLIQPAASASDQEPLSRVLQDTVNLAFNERLTVRRTDAGGLEAVSAERVGAAAALPPPDGPAAPDNGLVLAPEGTLAFSLGGSRRFGSVLRVENATGQTIAYDAYIVRLVGGERRGPARTNVCTVPAGLAVFEAWPEPVVQAVIANVRAAEGETPVCEPSAAAE